jgi:DNA-nicking Smr family endonuclease
MFMDAIAGTLPMDGRDRVRVAPLPAPVVAAPIVRDVVPSTIELTIEGGGEQVLARAPGVNRAQVAELKRGRVRPEASLDLHGKTVVEAEEALRRFLAESARVRRRCVLVIHGRGLHSGGGPAVLRDAVLHSLLGPLSGFVHCLSTAAPADGGSGATYVMVRP